MKSEQIVSWLRDKAARAEGRDYRKMLTVAAEKIMELETELREEMHRHDRLQDFEVAEAEELRKAREGNRWISVTERLPEVSLVRYKDCAEPAGYGEYYISGDVLAYDPNDKSIYIARCERSHANSKLYWHDKTSDYTIRPTHWMPLPEPPKGE